METIETHCEGQRRAKAGGELGPNGEWYEGGKFIATSDRPKTAPGLRHEPTTEEIAARAQREADRAAAAARWQAWAAPRLVRFSSLCTTLMSRPADHWCPPERWMKDIVETGHAGFLATMGLELSRTASLTYRQAEPVVKFVHGRRTKKNAEDFDALLADLTEECP